ncbi:MAG TPA: DUF3667 domain-containing protein [Povalibacter sp.]
MTIEGEAAGDVITGGIVAHTLEGAAAGKGAPGAAGHGTCRNCGATLAGAYCSSCGQAAHIHRSLVSLTHDILHGVFHFEGKVWRTIPELFLHPGRLTRRYIDGERAKFVSPMALYLFTVFLMFAVFAFTGGPLPHDGDPDSTHVNVLTPDGEHVHVGDWKAGVRQSMAENDKEIAAVTEQLKAQDLNEAQRDDLESELDTLRSAREGMEALIDNDWGRLSALGKKNQQDASGQPGFSTGWPALDQKLKNGMQDVQGNPRLLLYKLKINGYKFSWALIPLSLPFMWMLFFWRRDVHLYDHAVFVTYSITFIMQLLVLLSLLAVARIPPAYWGWAFLLVPVHMYKQLRGTYGLSRFGAFVRLMFLLLSAVIVMTIFTVMLVALGVLG